MRSGGREGEEGEEEKEEEEEEEEGGRRTGEEDGVGMVGWGWELWGFVRVWEVGYWVLRRVRVISSGWLSERIGRGGSGWVLWGGRSGRGGGFDGARGRSG